MTDSGMYNKADNLDQRDARACLLELLGKNNQFPLDVNKYVPSTAASSHFVALKGIRLRMRPMQWSAEKRFRKTKAWRPKLSHYIKKNTKP